MYDVHCFFIFLGARNCSFSFHCRSRCPFYLFSWWLRLRSVTVKVHSINLKVRSVTAKVCSVTKKKGCHFHRG